MKNKTLLILSALALLASCSSSTPASSGTTATPSEPASSNHSSAGSSLDDASSFDEDSSEGEEDTGTGSEESTASTEESFPDAATLAGGAEYDNSGFTIVNSDTGLTPAFVSGAYFIDEGGTYALQGTLKGMVYIAVPETEDDSGEVTLELNGVDMSYAGNSVIYCLSADSLDISAKKGTTNTITDLRERESAEEDLQGGGAIYAKVDTKLKGAGSLSVTGTYNNGVHVTKDLEIQKLNLTAKAPNNAIKGNDSLTVHSGNVTAISTGGDGLKTTDYDISSKGKQRGTLQIEAGTVTVYSACDGLDAAYDAILGVEGEAAGPTVSITTNKYSSYTDQDDIVASSETEMYLRTTAYDARYRYAVYFYDEDPDNGVWANATYLTTQRGRQTYYIYQLDRPTAYSSYRIYAFDANNAANSTADYVARSSGGTINANYDMVTFSQSGSGISTSGWSTYNASQGGNPGGPGGPGQWEEGNTDKADYSAKGIKAAHNVIVHGGDITIKAYDDGLHANDDGLFTSEATLTEGNVYLKGGNLTLDVSDDGVHADNDLYVEGGVINVLTSYEGLEGNRIYYRGGKSTVYATNDAVNASSGKNYATIDVSGGELYASVPTNGETDGIDSNGSYVQSGGIVMVAGKGQGGAWALDSEHSIDISGGTLVVFGGVERTVGKSSAITQDSRSGTYGNKAYTITFANGTLTSHTLPNYSYSYCRSWSELGGISSIA